MSRDRDAEIRAKLGDGYDFESMAAVLNVYRAATAVRYNIERRLLSDEGLSWGGFTALFVLWVWGPLEAHVLAAECGLAKGTLSGVLATLEKSGLVKRERLERDLRRVEVSATKAGLAKVQSVFPAFNRMEAELAGDLTLAEKGHLVDSLAKIRIRAEVDG